MKNLLKGIFITSLMMVMQHSAFASSSMVNVSLWDDGARMGVTADTTLIQYGHITFKVKNDSKFLEHEMLVIKVKNYHDALPYDSKTARVIEDDVKDYGEVSELKPGAFGSISLNLDPGKYVLFCNVAGHFEMGMFTQLVVTP